MNKIRISWSQYGRDISYLIRGIKKSKIKFKNVYGIPRGGLPLATVISHKFKVPIVLDKKKITKKTLVVDDISDKGSTFKKYKKYQTVCLYKTKWSISEPLTWSRSIKRRMSDWVVFPYE